ncbi:hypothetical protein JTE90_023065 [Oedothorax gibbosus]|uniref:Uncharacterized protein n=1 Tax=Oedothorax gibbosus TaxID=931172 RepID=A0AAV6UYZ7_9ARAC|nr:hypothetical protein JTE90_023065 [Oedothorax gibbosus]
MVLFVPIPKFRVLVSPVPIGISKAHGKRRKLDLVLLGWARRTNGGAEESWQLSPLPPRRQQIQIELSLAITCRYTVTRIPQ